jgi:hypothetical protein
MERLDPIDIVISGRSLQIRRSRISVLEDNWQACTSVDKLISVLRTETRRRG